MTVQHIADLNPDPKNARKHTPRNIGMIATSLQEVGAARSIVIDEDNNILAGNGTIEAAASVGITKMQVVDVDGETIVAVRRSGLNKKQKKRLSLFDNRTAETAEWDKDVIQGLFDEDQSIVEGLWKESELLEVLGELTRPEYQVIPLLFLPDQLTAVKTALDDVILKYGETEVWVARFREYDKVMNTLGRIMARLKARYVHEALIALARSWEDARGV